MPPAHAASSDPNNLPLAAAASSRSNGLSPLEGTRVVSGAELDRIIANSKSADPKGFADRLATIKKSSAFMRLLRETVGDPQGAVEFFAATASQEDANRVVENTQGKVFVFSGEGENTRVELVSNNSGMSTTLAMSGWPKCGKAWAAAFAWIAASYGVCVPFGTLPPAAFACAVAMGVMSLMPDFNDVCKK